MREANILHVPLKTTLAFVWSMVRDSKGMLAGMILRTMAFALVEILIPTTGKHLFDVMTAQRLGGWD